MDSAAMGASAAAPGTEHAMSHALSGAHTTFQAPAVAAAAHVVDDCSMENRIAVACTTVWCPVNVGKRDSLQPLALEGCHKLPGNPSAA
jgi:alcohol dehydrogenase class IV